jgi:hypothetical protein
MESCCPFSIQNGKSLLLFPHAVMSMVMVVVMVYATGRGGKGCRLEITSVPDMKASLYDIEHSSLPASPSPFHF